ncbi:MAG TPA: hypothetical protein VMI31_12910, partial [Fimbriimonadaceae bacterium]|nr:hypothetical protein [Fimbriimonadaceae bacterium]
RKYAAFNVGGSIVPPLLDHKAAWMVKGGGLAVPAGYDLEWEALQGNPHCAQLARIFDLAGVDFGRIDYAFKDGRLQVWEINTNPVLTMAAGEYPRHYRKCVDTYTSHLVRLLTDLDFEGGGAAVPVKLTPEVRLPLGDDCLAS